MNEIRAAGSQNPGFNHMLEKRENLSVLSKIFLLSLMGNLPLLATVLLPVDFTFSVG